MTSRPAAGEFSLQAATFPPGHKERASSESAPADLADGRADSSKADSAQRTYTPSSSENEGFLPLDPSSDKPRVVVLGSGWAACRFLRDIDTKKFDVVSISPRNHMVFTPLLASTCVGTLEFRSVAEPVEIIQPAVSTHPSSYFFLASCLEINAAKKEVLCETIDENVPEVNALEGEKQQVPQYTPAPLPFPLSSSSSSPFSVPRPPGSQPSGWRFRVAFDKLVIAVGAEASTFGIPGVLQNSFFLREVRHAMNIRRRLLLNLMKSDTPGLPEAVKRRLLSFVVVGGGPIGVEFSGELSDFIQRDVATKYAHVKDYVHVTLIEANEILSSFDVRLRGYATKQLEKSGVSLVRGVVKEVRPNSILLSDGSCLPYGLLVWATGVGPSDFVRSLPLPKSRGGRIGIDPFLRVGGFDDVYAIGDCAGYLESTGLPELPALAQVAERQGKYLARSFRSMAQAANERRKDSQRSGMASEGQQGGDEGGGAYAHGLMMKEEEAGVQPFKYRHLGSMATVGRYKALVDLRESKDSEGISLAGFASWFIWRSAYLTRVISWRNRLYVAVNWATTLVFGRDVTRI